MLHACTGSKHIRIETHQDRNTCPCELQIQMRDIPGFVDTRQQLLQLKSNVKGHWLGFAIAHHLNGNHALAVQILDSFEETQEEVPDNEQYEQSEMVMYKAMILKEGGQLEQALDLLQSNKVCSCNTRPTAQMALHGFTAP